MTNAQRMRDFRQRFDLTAAEAGSVFGVSTATINKIEQGRRQVNNRFVELALKNIKKSDLDALTN